MTSYAGGLRNRFSICHSARENFSIKSVPKSVEYIPEKDKNDRINVKWTVELRILFSKLSGRSITKSNQ